MGWIDIDRPIRDNTIPKDHLLGLLPKWEGPLDYGPATWDERAYIKSFEKFTYADALPDIAAAHPSAWEFALWATKREYSFLRDSVMIPMVLTEKNLESTPCFPKSIFYKTEEAYVKDYGYDHYVKQFDEIKAGARPTPLWYLFLKKETLKKKKIEDSDIRQILCADPAFSRIGLVFEQDQNQRMKNQTEKHHGQCGWCPFEGGWDRRMRRLDREGNTFVEMDWSRYDGTIPNQVFHAIKSIRFNFLAKEYRTDENRSIYEWYCKNLTNRTVLLPSGEVTKQYNGNPSGQVSTTTDNNMCNTFFQAFEFIYINKLSVDEAKQLWKSYDTIVYGDDRLTSTPLIPSNYTGKVVEMYRDIFGMWVKPENVKTSDTLVGLSFCGFSNIMDRGKYVPVPTNVNKLIASLVTPCKKLPDIDSLAGKILSYKVLLHNLPDDDYSKQFVLACEVALQKHLAAREMDYVSFTREVLDYLWRGGP